MSRINFVSNYLNYQGIYIKPTKKQILMVEWELSITGTAFSKMRKLSVTFPQKLKLQEYKVRKSKVTAIKHLIK